MAADGADHTVAVEMDRITARFYDTGRELADGGVKVAVHLASWVAWHVDRRPLDAEPARSVPEPGEQASHE
jgi:hypothetical protein